MEYCKIFLCKVREANGIATVGHVRARAHEVARECLTASQVESGLLVEGSGVAYHLAAPGYQMSIRTFPHVTLAYVDVTSTDPTLDGANVANAVANAFGTNLIEMNVLLR